MGARFSGQCFASASDAAAAMWSGVAPVISTGSPPIVSTVELASDWQIVARQDGVVLSVTAAPTVAFAPCDPMDSVTDGFTLAWLVVAVWAAAWAVSVLRRPLSMR